MERTIFRRFGIEILPIRPIRVLNLKLLKIHLIFRSGLNLQSPLPKQIKIACSIAPISDPGDHIHHPAERPQKPQPALRRPPQTIQRLQGRNHLHKHRGHFTRRPPRTTRSEPITAIWLITVRYVGYCRLR